MNAAVSPGWTLIATEILASIVLLLLLVALAVAAALFVYDRLQTQNAILRNFPVIGHSRKLLQHFGVFFRRYFSAADREELPFNRAQRQWVHFASVNADNTRAFGSTRDMRVEGMPFFVNAPFPPLGEKLVTPKPLVIGPYARQPYAHAPFFNRFRCRSIAS